MFRKLMLVMATGTPVLAGSACNTVKGAGKDRQSAGDSGRDASIDR